MKKFAVLLDVVFMCICSVGLSSQKASASWVDTLPAIPYNVPFSANWSNVNCSNGSEAVTFDRYFFYSNNGQIRIVYIEQGYTFPVFEDYYNGYFDIYLQNNPHLQAFNLISGSWVMQGCMNWVGPDKNQYSVGCPQFHSTIDLYFSGNYDYGSEYCNLGHLTTGKFFTADISLPPPATPLSFPLQTTCSGVPCSPYTAEISSIMDHSISTPYTKNGVVLAFNGEEGDVNNGCWCYSTNSACNSSNYTSCAVAGFKNSNGTSFFPNGEINYADIYLYYDGHPGYDYPATSGMDINAPANGTLCVATSTTQQPSPSDVWRDTAHCPYSTAGSTSWSGYHTFYIIHEGLYINGSTNDYMTVFLHSDDLESSVRADIEQYGYATVTKSQHIADVGGYGPGGPTAFPYHMHFEVYKKNGENWDRVDPNGDGTNNILWEQN